MASIWLLLAILVILVLVFGGGILYQLLNAALGIILLLILVGIAVYIWHRI